MKILVLNGSPTRDGNTVALVNAFKEGAESKGHEVTVLDVAHKKVNGCMSCGYCHGQGNGKCVQQDDMQQIYPLLMEAEIIAFASPIYYFGMTSQIMAAMQRVYCIGKPNAKKAALLLSSGSPGTTNGAITTYKDMIGYLGMEDAGICCLAGEDNKAEDKMAAIKEMAKKL